MKDSTHTEPVHYGLYCRSYLFLSRKWVLWKSHWSFFLQLLHRCYWKFFVLWSKPFEFAENWALAFAGLNFLLRNKFEDSLRITIFPQNRLSSLFESRVQSDSVGVRQCFIETKIIWDNIVFKKLVFFDISKF